MLSFLPYFFRWPLYYLSFGQRVLRVCVCVSYINKCVLTRLNRTCCDGASREEQSGAERSGGDAGVSQGSCLFLVSGVCRHTAAHNNPLVLGDMAGAPALGAVEQNGNEVKRTRAHQEHA